MSVGDSRRLAVRSDAAVMKPHPSVGLSHRVACVSLAARKDHGAITSKDTVFSDSLAVRKP